MNCIFFGEKTLRCKHSHVCMKNFTPKMGLLHLMQIQNANEMQALQSTIFVGDHEHKYSGLGKVTFHHCVWLAHRTDVCNFPLQRLYF